MRKLKRWSDSLRATSEFRILPWQNCITKLRHHAWSVNHSWPVLPHDKVLLHWHCFKYHHEISCNPCLPVTEILIVRLLHPPGHFGVQNQNAILVATRFCWKSEKPETRSLVLHGYGHCYGIWPHAVLKDIGCSLNCLAETLVPKMTRTTIWLVDVRIYTF